MTDALPAQKVEWIPLDRITVVNPRTRNQKVFKEIVDNIAQVGLKRPITVTRRIEADGPFYDLVCGQGRLEAYLALGQKEVPALVVSADPEDCLIASLVENCARRQHSAIDLLQDIGRMRQRGQSIPDIARKTGLTIEYVSGVTNLLERGEERLLQSVEARGMPLSVAVEIAEAEDHEVQQALHSAYESGLLRGKRLIAAKRLVEVRKRRGREIERPAPTGERMSSAALLRAYQEDVSRKKEMIRRANAAKSRLMIIVEAMRQLKDDEVFVRLVEQEKLSTLPDRLARRVEVGRQA
jgi:ParB family chromosome partitioning protein